MKNFDLNSNLWPDKSQKFFEDLKLKPIKQISGKCVSTSLAIISGVDPDYFYDKINTQDPISWSDSLHQFNMKLAYCPTDIRKLKFYMNELIEFDDLFLLSYYIPFGPKILKDPDENGWICSSHIVVLYKDKIYEPKDGKIYDANKHSSNNHHTKRIFRVVKKDFYRGL